jgi:hypothetical protein
MRCNVNPSIFKWVKGKRYVYLLLLYVDDILAIAKKQELERLEAVFLKEFWWITMAVGNSHSCIIMQISVVNGQVMLDMQYYLHCILEGYNNP